jgi:hypothetical protein
MVIMLYTTVAINEREKTIDILLSVLANKLLNQGFLLVKLKSFQNFYCRHHNLINCTTEEITMWYRLRKVPEKGVIYMFRKHVI